jgi:hypothetical protein
MNIPKEFVKDLEAFPAVLRELLDAELAAGNEIKEIGHGFPAPPAGAYIKLAKPLRSRPRASGDGIDFYDRNSSLYSGEITDAKRFFFLLEPPHPPEPEPDMNAIRAALHSKQATPPAEQIKPARKAARSKALPLKSQAAPKPEPPKPPTVVERFLGSMEMNYEKWHDGIGYDLDIIKTATPEELVEIENLLVNRPVSDWRDVEALAALNSPRARALLRKKLKGGNPELATAVTGYAPEIAADDEHTAALVAALEHSEVYGGLTQALLQVEEFHPPQIIDALFRGVLAREGDTAVHFAAMLMFLHGKAETSFDWDQHPFFLRFHTNVRAERQTAFRELCQKVGVDANPYLATQKKTSSTRRTRRGDKI